MSEEKSSPEKKLKIKIGDVELEAKYRQFKSGKKGYGSYGIVKIEGYPHRLSLNLIEI